MILILCIILIIAVVYRYLIRPLFYWKDRGIVYRTPWPIVGNMASTAFRRKSMFQQTIDFYNEFPTKRYNGVFQFTRPMLLIRDLDLLKQIMIKDFDHFTDHNGVFPENEPLMGRNLFSLKGQRWRDIRATVSPTFTSSKMRYMFSLISECAQRFCAHIEKKASSTYVVETKDLYSRFANDVVASVVFGYNCDSVAEPDHEFYRMGKDATNITGWRFVKFFLFTLQPRLAERLKLSFFPAYIFNFFNKLVKDNIEKREKHGIVRPDMIQLLLDARAGRPKYNELSETPVSEGFAAVEESNIENAKPLPETFLNHEDITAQAFVFFFSGFDAVSTMICFVSYELALNIDVQEKLQAEIDDTLQKSDGQLTYQSLLHMKYLDMVVSETLRKWALGFQTDRMCIKDYEIKPVHADEKPVIIEKGTPILIPIAGIHMNPKIYPNPEKFDPERFNDENRQNMSAFNYMPFGAGPRNCIASRFALLECKTLICHLLSKFTITVVEKTQIPLVLSKTSFNMMPDGGFWLGFQLRKPYEM